MIDLFGNKIQKRKQKKKKVSKKDYKAYVALWSGGKDSTTMVDKMLRNGDRIDFIVFSNTKMEFKEMDEYIIKVSKYWRDRYNANIILLETHKTLDNLFFNVRGENGKISKNNHGKISGLLSPSMGFCEWRRDSKIRPFEKWMSQKGLKADEVLCFVGFTIDETNRMNRYKHESYPLVDEYRMSEHDCKQYLIDMEMENPLYKHFNRTGCRLCPYQSEADFYNIFRYHQDVWGEFKVYEKRVKEHSRAAVNSSWFINFQTCEDMENKFLRWQDLGLYPDTEPIKDCFCRI